MKKEEAKDPYLEACRSLEATPVTKFLKYRENETVSLKHAGLGPKGAHALAVALVYNQSIRNLDLTGNTIEADGGIAIGEMLQRNRTLGSLILADNNIAHGGKTIADGICGNKSLTTLSLRGKGGLFYYVVVWPLGLAWIVELIGCSRTSSTSWSCHSPHHLSLATPLVTTLPQSSPPLHHLSIVLSTTRQQTVGSGSGCDCVHAQDQPTTIELGPELQ